MSETATAKVAVSVGDAAARLSVSPSHVRALIRSGVLATIPNTGRRVLIAVRELERFAADGG